MRSSLALLLLCVLSWSFAAAAQPRVTDKVFFDVEIGGAPRGRIVMNLYGEVRTGAHQISALTQLDVL
jgi:hypothetical protein